MEILYSQLADIQILSDQRESEIEEAMDEYAERKFAALSDIKKRYALKIKIGTKAGSDLKLIESQRLEELRQEEVLLKE